METQPNHFDQHKQLLTDFIRLVGECIDTPSLIVLIAADADYLQLCRSIVKPAANSNPAFTETLVSVCRNNGMDPDRLKEKLSPAARALGIVQSPVTSPDYYQLLGVRSKADTHEIKKAFRRKAVTVHPDAGANQADSSLSFVELNDAYRTLRDPALRHRYDIERHQPLRWRERPGLSSLPTGNSSPIFFWYFYGLFFIFLILLLFLDLIVF